MSEAVDQIESAGEALDKVKTEIAKRIIGQNDVVNQSLTAILAGGHALLVGVPGLAKPAWSRRLGPSWASTQTASSSHRT